MNSLIRDLSNVLVLMDKANVLSSSYDRNMPNARARSESAAIDFIRLHRDEIVTAVQDAKRYRWLRDKSEPGLCSFYLSVGMALKDIRFQPSSVDNYIDAALTSDIQR